MCPRPGDRRPRIELALAILLAGPLSGVAHANTVAAGPTHTLVVTDKGAVYALGENDQGQAGQPVASARVAVPTAVAGLEDIVAVAAGAEHSLALDRRGRLWVFGGNRFGQLGVDGVAFTSTPTLVPGLADVAAIAAGDFHSVALTRNGTVYAWGRGDEGQLDNGSLEDRHEPTIVRGLSGVAGIAAGSSHTVAILGPLDGGALKVFGRNQEGQAGDGTLSPASNPVVADSLRSMVQGAAGLDFTLGLAADGHVHSWGGNRWGQLARSENDALDAVVGMVPSLRDVRLLAAGGAHALALTARGTLLEWGAVPAGTSPTEVAGLQDVVALAAGGGTSPEGVPFGHAVVVTVRGEVFAWGSNDHEQLGDGTTRSSTTPVRIADAGFAWTGKAPSPRPSRRAQPSQPANSRGARGETGSHGDAVESIVADPMLSLPTGTYAAGTAVMLTCTTAGAEIHYTINGVDPTTSDLFVTTDHSLIVGNYTLKAKAFHTTDTPSGVVSATYTVTGTMTPGMASGGNGFSVYLASDGTLWSTGDNGSGVLGAPGASRTVVDRVAGLTGVIAIASGYSHSLALRSDNTLWAWGSNGSGQLGDGTQSAHTYPYKVPLANVIAIAAAKYQSLAVASDGKVYAWGDNTYGQLGLGNNTTPVKIPTQVPGITTATAVAAGQRHSLVLLSSRTVLSFGFNSSGQLGLGDYTDRWNPTSVLDLTDIVAIASGVEALHSLALRSDGSLFSFGANSSGQLGDGTILGHFTPEFVLAPPFAKIAVGDSYSLALGSDGAYWAWGSQSNGQLGDGQTSGCQRPLKTEGF